MRYIVHDDHGFVYFVVQKVACTSIKIALRPLFDFETPVKGGARRNGPKRGGVHKRFARSGYQIDENELLRGMDGKYRGYFKFGFVRNPWDRLVSCYFNKFRADGSGLELPDEVDVELHLGMSFAEFVEAVHAIPDESSNPHFKSQYTVFCPGEDKVVLADFVGSFENLAADFDHVAREIGVPSGLELPHKPRNLSSREGRPYAEFYDDRLRRLVHERFRDDVEMFGYSFRERGRPSRDPEATRSY